jgi:hypothetical protein
MQNYYFHYEHFGGEIKFDAIINVKDGNSKSTIELKDSSVYIKEVADGVTIDPTKTGTNVKAFDWTTLNLNANMKDLEWEERCVKEFMELWCTVKQAEYQSVYRQITSIEKSWDI